MINVLSIENYISEVLKKFPLLKKLAKRSYQYVSFALFFNRRKVFFLNPVLNINHHNRISFFGYYDKSPINIDNSLVLFHSTDYDSSKPPPKKGGVDIIVYNLEKGTVSEILKTESWNWQQGARLQWLTNDLYAFNDFDENMKRYITRVNSIQKKSEVSRFQYPIQDAFNDKYFLSINYRRLNTLCPDYGYRNLPNLDKDEIYNLDNDGIWYVDLNSGDNKLLLSLSDIVKFKYNKKFKEGRHYVNHIMISPNGKKFVFLHRYNLKGVRYDRLILSDINGNMKLLSDLDMVSHYYWSGNDIIFSFMRGGNGNGYYEIDCNEAVTHAYEDQRLQMYGDGHPNIYENKFVTDIYPDKSRTQTLIYGDFEKKKHIVLAHLHNSLKYDGECRCDLHPRLSYDGKKVFFDTVHYGKRRLCMMDLRNINI